MLEILKAEHAFRDVRLKPEHFISALIHAQEYDPDKLRTVMQAYREAKVWETRQAIEQTTTYGWWRVPLRGPGQSWGEG